MIKQITLLLFIGLAFWSCEDEEKVPEATPVGTWNLVSRCEYDYGDCTVNCTEEELEAYCSMEDDNSSTAPDNEAECNNLNGYWVKELTSILTINDDMTGTLEESARYDSDEDEFYNLTLVENSTGGYLVTSDGQSADVEVFLTLSDNGESLYLQIIVEDGGDDCRLYTFTKQ
jgi:hypothetical protein